MITHNETVRNNLNSQCTTLKNTLENINTHENSATINKLIEDLATEKQVLSKKLKQKRQTKNLKSGAMSVRFGN